MCFRPTKVERKPIKCPECGTMNPGVAKVCIKCKLSLESLYNQPTENKSIETPENK